MKIGVACLSLSLWLSVLCSSGLPQETTGKPADSKGLTGGGGGADFTELMNLIQQTIDPLAWADASSTMVPYPAGVYVDPQGQMRQVKIDDAVAQEIHQVHPQGPQSAWLTESKMRVVSLRRLDDALAMLPPNRSGLSQELHMLAGLSRIDFVKIDAAHEDLLLAGPAHTGIQPNRSGPPGFYLADLMLLANLVSSHTPPLGCSIDPTDTGIMAAQQLIEAAGASKRLSSNPQKFTDQMQEKIGPHNVSIFGMPANSPTALALVIADEHMKQIGFGNATTSVPIKTYFDHLDRQSKVPQQSLIRWWFAYANEPVLSNDLGNFFRLPPQCVALMSEQQWVSQLGRKATGVNDPCADAFATEMTAKLGELRLAHPAYARMCCIFETALALQLALESSGQASLQAWFPNLVQNGRFTSHEPPAVKTVSGLSAWHRLSNGTVVAVVSGGVSIDARHPASRSRWQPTELGTNITIESTGESTDPRRWWWD